MSTDLPRLALIEEMMRDFSRDAPGRSRNRTSTINPATAKPRRLDEESFKLPSLDDRGASSHELERSSPARFIKEVDYDSAQKQEPVAPSRLCVLIVRSLERPIDEHRPANDVLFRNESPVTAVQTYAPMIAHRKVVAGRHHNVISLDVTRQIDRPVCPYIGVVWWRRNRRK